MGSVDGPAVGACSGELMRPDLLGCPPVFVGVPGFDEGLIPKMGQVL